jgi:hypothetical protein
MRRIGIKLTLLLKLCFLGTLLAQTSEKAAIAIQTPININASDGVYDKFILIRWEPGGSSSNYRLFRATAANGKSMVELTKGWQNSTWFCDYSAEKNRDYYYAVMGQDGGKTSALSAFDKGFLKKPVDIATDESITSTTPDKYAVGKQIFALVSAVTPDTSDIEAGDTLGITLGLQNIFEEPTPRTTMKIFLSNDEVWDFEDQSLLTKIYSGFPASLKFDIEESVAFPKELLAGSYYLIVVLSPENEILQSKTGLAKINIVRL